MAVRLVLIFYFKTSRSSALIVVIKFRGSTFHFV
jgi:hypothetical protein